jgi:glycosyltransferase involved in cell wall biosynthesis
MKICSLIPSLRSGGAESLVSMMSKLLAEGGHEVTIVNITGTSAPRNIQNCGERVKIINLNCSSKSPVGVLKFMRLYALNQWDVVFSHLTPTLIHGAALKSIFPKATWHYVEHNPTTATMGMRKRRGLRELVTGQLYKLCNSIVCVSERPGLEYFQKFFPNFLNKVSVIHNGLDVRSVLRSAAGIEPLALRERFDVPTDKILAGIVGRLIPVKGHKRFLEAVALNRLSLDRFHFLIIGEGELMTELKSLTEKLKISEMVTFTGNLSKPGEIYGLLDILLITSLTEGLPIVLLEALALDKEIVSMDIGGIREVIGRDSPSLVQPGDMGMFVSKLIRVAKFISPGETTSKPLNNLVRTEMTLEKMCDKYLALVDSNSAVRRAA